MFPPVIDQSRPVTPTLWTPALTLDTRGGGCRLTLVGVTCGNGETLQEAGNDLLVRLYDLAAGVRRGGLRYTTDLGRLDPRVGAFLWEIGELIARGGDLRARVLG